MTSHSELDQTQGPHGVVVFWAVLGAALSWALHIGARYPLIPIACRQGSELILHAVTAISTLGIALAAVASWSLLRDKGSGHLGAVRQQRLRFLGWAGLALAGLFLIAVVGELLPTFFYPPCDEGRTDVETNA